MVKAKTTLYRIKYATNRLRDTCAIKMSHTLFPTEEHAIRNHISFEARHITAEATIVATAHAVRSGDGPLNLTNPMKGGTLWEVATSTNRALGNLAANIGNHLWNGNSPNLSINLILIISETPIPYPRAQENAAYPCIKKYTRNGPILPPHTENLTPMSRIIESSM